MSILLNLALLVAQRVPASGKKLTLYAGGTAGLWLDFQFALRKEKFKARWLVMKSNSMCAWSPWVLEQQQSLIAW